MMLSVHGTFLLNIDFFVDNEQVEFPLEMTNKLAIVEYVNEMDEEYREEIVLLHVVPLQDKVDQLNVVIHQATLS